MNSLPTYTRFCGIDVAKAKHVFCVIDLHGQSLIKPKSFTNDAEGFEQLLTGLKKIGGPKGLLIGLEATGHYWYSLHDHLTRHGYTVVVLNPVQTAQQAKLAIRKCKTDRYDAHVIAILLKSGVYKPALVPGERAMTCRQLTRLRYELVRKITRTKQLLWSKIHPVWPEFETFFANPFCATGRKLLELTPTPQDLIALGEPELIEVIRKTSRGKYDRTCAQTIYRTAAVSVGMKRGLEGFQLSIRILLQELDALRGVLKSLDTQILEQVPHLSDYLLTLPGINSILAVSLFGEIDPIETFKTPEHLVAFAGLDPTVYQTGQYNAPNHPISKRGSPHLRKTLWTMAYHACYQEGDLRTFWLKKRGQGVHHLAAVTAVARKLCHVVWRIMTDKRPFRPEGKPTKTIHSEVS
jgi:transposase